MIVLKFGGTSVQDAAAIGRLAEIVRARLADRPLVVVSALAKVTDSLLALGELVGDLPAADAALDALLVRHASVAADLGVDNAMAAIASDRAAVRAHLAAAKGQPLTARGRDRLVSHGELWSSRLVAAALRRCGLDAEWVDARQIMATDDRYGCATPDGPRIAEAAGRLLRPPLEAGRVPVTQGYIGAAPDASPTTLGRGGSDYSASLLGAALGVKRVEIWTDVSGIMTADPRIVPTARALASASYEEAAELATFGAKVLHPATAVPLVERGIPIAVKNSFEPAAPGTIIGPFTAPGDDGAIRSISCKKGVILINLRMPRMLGAYGVLREIFEVFERHETSVDVLASSEVSVSVTVEDAVHLDALVADLRHLGEVTMVEQRAIVAVVGNGLRQTPGVAARAFQALGDVNVELVSQGASAINMTLVVRDVDAPEAVRRLHREFFDA